MIMHVCDECAQRFFFSDIMLVHTIYNISMVSAVSVTVLGNASRTGHVSSLIHKGPSIGGAILICV